MLKETGNFGRQPRLERENEKKKNSVNNWGH